MARLDYLKRPPLKELVLMINSISVAGNHVVGYDATLSALKCGRLEALLNFRASKDHQEDGELDATYDHDLTVIGGGSGGLVASKEAAFLGKKVALCKAKPYWNHLGPWWWYLC